MDIEFLVQDLFALTRPQWKIASNLEEACKAFQLAMAQDQKSSGIDKAIESEEPDSDGALEAGICDNDAETELPEQDGDDNSESDEEVDVSCQIRYYLIQLKLLKADSNGNNHVSALGTDSEDEAIVVTRQEEIVDPEDEADFEREYAKMMSESLDSRKYERKSAFDVPLPMKRKDVTTNSETWIDESNQNNNIPAGTMVFSLLTKRGNRQQVCFIKSLFVEFD